MGGGVHALRGGGRVVIPPGAVEGEERESQRCEEEEEEEGENISDVTTATTDNYDSVYEWGGGGGACTGYHIHDAVRGCGRLWVWGGSGL